MNQKHRPLIGLALSGGAARGIAHIGVLRALHEHQIPIDCIAGTSAGSIVGAAVAAGLPLDEIELLAQGLRWRDIGRMTMSRLGVQSNERLEQYLRQRMSITRFEELPIRFAAVATNLKSGEPVVITEGEVPFAVRASCAIPGWYIPVTDKQGRQLVDGGLVANIPAVAARSLGADLVIAIDVNAEGASFLGPSMSIIGVLLQSILLVQRTAAQKQLEAADLVIKPRVGHIRWDEMARAPELLTAGYEAGLAHVQEIKTLIDEAIRSAPRWYQFRRRKKLTAKGPITSPT